MYFQLKNLIINYVLDNTPSDCELEHENSEIESAAGNLEDEIKNKKAKRTKKRKAPASSKYKSADELLERERSKLSVLANQFHVRSTSGAGSDNDAVGEKSNSTNILCK